MELSINSLTTKDSNTLRIMYQAAHDMRSPIAGLVMVIAHSKELNEEARALLQSFTSRLYGISKSLLDDYDKEKTGQAHATKHQVIDCATFLDQVVAEKKCEYNIYPDMLLKKVPSSTEAISICADPFQLARSLSDLINNSVEALQDKTQCKVTISLNADHQHVMITVQDNGIGMPEATLNKLNQRTGFTNGKAHGHGIGMTQVWDMLESNGGKMVVRSKLGEGTTIELIFLRHLHE